MDITTIDAISYATRVGAVAAAELYGLLSDLPAPPPNWFNPTSAPTVEDDESAHAAWLDELGDQVAELGQYVCGHQVDQGERLYRWGGSKGIVPSSDWPKLELAGQQAFEAFVDTVRHTYLGLAVAQKAIEDARRAAGVKPPGLKLEDSIFEQEEPLGKLRDEAIAAAPLQQRYQREAEAARIRAEQEKAAQDKAERKRGKFNGADPNKFDHDGDGKPGGSRKRPPAPQPVSAGDTVPKVQPNRGGRGRRKQA